MKKNVLAAFAIMAAFATNAQTIVQDDFSGISVKFDTPELTLDAKETANGKYLQPVVDGYLLGGNIGQPALPVLSSTIVVPLCSSIEVRVENAVYDTLQYDALQWFPLQPSRSKSDFSTEQLVIDNEAYTSDAFLSLPTARVEVMGIARDRRLANLIFSPVRINPVRSEYIVCRKADVNIRFVDADEEATVEYYNRYHSPAFGGVSTLNRLFSTKDVRTTSPIRMLIVAHSAFRCNALDRFATWKRMQGMMVDVVYYDELGMTSESAIGNHIKSYYNNASASSPAPTYLLLIGDYEQLPAFQSQLSSGWNDHISDLYFATWSANDNLPDCYQGRLSVTDTSTLTGVVNKILLYETYSFPNDSYLSNAALIAGIDGGRSGDYGYTHADPTMDYIARFYVREENGFTNVRYYKNNTSFAPDGVTVTGSCQNSTTASALRSYYNGGVGWVNYSAHGDWYEWYSPKLNLTNVEVMTNSNKPMFMIGNCCLTNKFEKTVCFGEALLRKNNNGGAVSYIGGTNSTYWNEDFYWSVGIRNGISNTMNTNYNAARLGVYDRLFHTHNERFSDYAITAGSMVFFGNMSVNNSSSSNTMKNYYWEVYELMGDPSLMPWLGKAQELTNFSASLDGTTVNLSTVPYAYVAIVDTINYQLYGAAYTDAYGNGHISLNGNADLTNATFSVTAQGYKPYFTRAPRVGIDLADEASLVKVYPNPANEHLCVSGENIKSVQLLDYKGNNVIDTYSRTDNTLTLNVKSLPRGIYYVRVQGQTRVETFKVILR